jgi:pimeloyl-ACP methyl ester carboxylesterase
VTDTFFELNEVRLHAVSHGSGPLILFLHGFPEFWYAWREQLREFGRDHRAVAVDMRGYNLSSKPVAVADYALPLLIADVRELLEQLSPGDRAVLVGHDWGGVVAWELAAAHPDYLRKLVILNAPHPTIFARELLHNPAQQQASAYIRLFRSERAEAVLSANEFAALKSAVFDTAARPDAFSNEDRRAYLGAWSQPGALTGSLNYYRALGIGPPDHGPSGSVTEAALAAAQRVPLRIIVPTLVLWGERDQALLPGNLAGLDSLVPDLRIERFPDATHWIVREEPARVNQAIRASLE